MLSQVVGWIEIDASVTEPIDWGRNFAGAPRCRHRLAGICNRIAAPAESCFTDFIDADVDQLQVDLQAEFEQLLRLAR